MSDYLFDYLLITEHKKSPVSKAFLVTPRGIEPLIPA